MKRLSRFFARRHEFGTYSEIMTFEFQGAKVCLENRKFGSMYQKYWKKGKFYENDFLLYIQYLDLTGTYLDVGANCGNHSVFFAKFCKSDIIYAFEPVPRFIDLTISNLILNRVLDKTRLVPFGLSNTEGYVDLDIHDRTDTIYTTMLDKLNLDGTVSLIKLDIEGMEIKALQGGRRLIEQHHPRIFAEARTQTEFTDLSSYLESIGYLATGRVWNASPTYEFVPEN